MVLSPAKGKKRLLHVKAWRTQKVNFHRRQHRCISAGMKCVQVKHWQPEDLEYIQLAAQETLASDVHDIYEQLHSLESAIQSFKDGTETDSSDSWAAMSMNSTMSPVTSFSDANEISSTSASPKAQHATQMGSQFAVFVDAANHAIKLRSKDETNQPERSIQLFRNPTKEMPEWTLTLSSSGLSINTSIKTFADMVYYLPQLTSFAMKNAELPIPAHIRENLQSLNLKRIQSPWFAIRRSILLASQKNIETMKNTNLSEQGTQEWVDDIAADQIARRLIKAYFQCQHYRRIIIHRRTFLDMFIKGKDNILSGPVCAFSAAITAMRCRHVLGIIPLTEQFAAGEFFFAKARDAFADSFDDISLENYFTLVWMAKYKVGVLKPEEALNYLDMAERQCDLLAPLYTSEIEEGKQRQNDLGNAEMYRRLLLARRDIMSSIRYLQNRRGVPLVDRQRLVPFPVCNNERVQLSPPRIMSDDTISEKRALLRDRFGHMVSAFHPKLSRTVVHKTDLVF